MDKISTFHSITIFLYVYFIMRMFILVNNHSYVSDKHSRLYNTTIAMLGVTATGLVATAIIGYSAEDIPWFIKFFIIANACLPLAILYDNIKSQMNKEMFRQPVTGYIDSLFLLASTSVTLLNIL